MTGRNKVYIQYSSMSNDERTNEKPDFVSKFHKKKLQFNILRHWDGPSLSLSLFQTVNLSKAQYALTCYCQQGSVLIWLCDTCTIFSKVHVDEVFLEGKIASTLIQQ